MTAANSLDLWTKYLAARNERDETRAAERVLRPINNENESREWQRAALRAADALTEFRAVEKAYFDTYSKVRDWFESDIDDAGRAELLALRDGDPLPPDYVTPLSTVLFPDGPAVAYWLPDGPGPFPVPPTLERFLIVKRRQIQDAAE